MKIISLQSDGKTEIKRAELTLAQDRKVLFSYGRPAAALVPGKGFVRVDEVISKATERHILDWVGDAPVERVSQAYLDGLLEGARA